jgi:hypothetical protein
MNPTTMSCHSNGAPIATTEFSSYIIVHQDHAGFVIGAIVKDIAAKTNTWIRIQPVNEWSFGNPWFLIKGRNEQAVATAHHYISTISEEAERRNPKWSTPLQLQMELEEDDIANIDEFYSTTEMDNTMNEYVNCPDHEFNAALTDFECKDLDERIAAETTYQLPPCVACEQGIENQQGHYGGCIADPYLEDQTIHARSVPQRVTNAPTNYYDRPNPCDGWSGPFEATYLSKRVNNPETGKCIKSFKSFDDAVAMANELGDACAGITKTVTGYSLRVGPNLKSNIPGDPSGLTSWIK